MVKTYNVKKMSEPNRPPASSNNLARRVSDVIKTLYFLLYFDKCKHSVIIAKYLCNLHSLTEHSFGSHVF